jgi:[ribosomal protein S18]-alanine N-acetyltransferase
MSAILSPSAQLIRPMQSDDIADVMRVENAAYSHPWTEGILRDCVRVGYSCWVCECGDDLIGHMIMSIAAGEAHLLNLCVAPEWQLRGVGRRLLCRSIRVAREREADTMFLEVRDSNEAARRLYESEGFCEIGRRRGYYPAGANAREDAVVYARALL